MYRVLIADDNFEDRELLKMEIEKALKDKEADMRFVEAASVRQAREHLRSQPFDLLTLDIEFDRMNEGLEALPEIFDEYPALNIIVISGRLNKSDVAEELFRFTKDNVLKGKRWVRHFDVLDKKDDKTNALRTVHSFSLKQSESMEKVKNLFLVAESYLEKDEIEKCQEIYQKIQDVSPEDSESKENLRLLKGLGTFEYALEYLRKGETVVASLLLGHHIENRLKAYTRRIIRRSYPGLFDCLKELERAGRISPYKKSIFQQLLKLRNKAVHKPSTITEEDFDGTLKNLMLLEADF